MATTKPKPTLFIASSSEAKDAAEVLEEGLGRVADVKVWWSEDLWTPGKTTLDVLLRDASRYDFAVAVFYADDEIDSRGEKKKIPRDNVLFEAGLFMANLGPERTFVVVPKAEEVKILSDLAGVNVLGYPAPNAQTGLKGALWKTVTTLRKRIRELQREAASPPYAALCGPSSFSETGGMAGGFLTAARSQGKALAVSNIALDMEMSWSLLRDHVLQQTWDAPVEWRSLILDWQAAKEMSGVKEAVTWKTAQLQERKMVRWCGGHSKEFPGRRVSFECRAYSHLPLLHGILFNDDELYFSLLSYDEDSVGGVGYCRMSASLEDRLLRAELAAEYTTAFRGWFEKLWRESREVWPPSGS